MVLGGVFLAGFSEAVSLAIPLVAAYLLLNAVIIVVGVAQIAAHPDVLSSWTQVLSTDFGGVGDILATSVLAFPLLVLGLSGSKPVSA